MKENLTLIVIAFMLICSGTLIFPGLTAMMIAFAYISYYKLNNGSISTSYSRPFLGFLTCCYISILANLLVDYHIFVFTLVIIICTPFCVSKENYLFERKLIKTILLTFPAVSMICFYCYLKGINAFNPDAGSTEELDTSFSAIYPHPMWLGPIGGLGNIALLWSIFNVRRIWWKLILIVLLLLSIYVTTVSGSRTAFFASIICIGVFIIYKIRNTKHLLLYASIIGILTFTTAPIYYSHSTQMQNKFEYGKKFKYGSRTTLFEEGLRHYYDSPIIGSGFATAWYSNNNLVLGRLESGSGWLSILFQIGIIGILSMTVILLKVKRTILYCKNDSTLQLFFICLLFICIHSCFEGYLLTIGYYIGIVFWLLIGHISIYPEMTNKYNLDFKSVKINSITNNYTDII